MQKCENGQNAKNLKLSKHKKWDNGQNAKF